MVIKFLRNFSSKIRTFRVLYC